MIHFCKIPSTSRKVFFFFHRESLLLGYHSLSAWEFDFVLKVLGFLPCLLLGAHAVGEQRPSEDGLQALRTAGEAVTQLRLEFLFAQAINNRRDALRQAEEGKGNHGRELLGLLLNEPPFEEFGQDEIHKVREDEDRQLGAVQRDGPTPG